MARSTLVMAAVLLGSAGAVAGGMLALRGLDAPSAETYPGTFDRDDPLLGRRSYVFCQGCHGLDGSGVPHYTPALAGSRWLNGDPRAAALIVLHGYDATAETGADYVSSRMLGHAAQMSDDEIAAALSWTRSQWGNAAAAVAPRLVADLRLRHADRSTPWTPAELRALTQDGAR